MRRARLFATTVAALLLPAAPAPAGDPVMPLSEVGRDAVHGLHRRPGDEISSFGVEILDVIDGDASGQGPRLLVGCPGPRSTRRASAPASPARRCTADDQGTVATPARSPSRSGSTAATSCSPRRSRPSSARRSTRGRRRGPRAAAARCWRRAKPLATPLTVPGVSATLGRALERAGRRAGRPVLAAPAGPLGTFPPQPCGPGPRSASPTRRATSRSARSGRSPTRTATTCGRSAMRSRRRRARGCSSRTPTSTA